MINPIIQGIQNSLGNLFQGNVQIHTINPQPYPAPQQQPAQNPTSRAE